MGDFFGGIGNSIANVAGAIASPFTYLTGSAANSAKNSIYGGQPSYQAPAMDAGSQSQVAQQENALQSSPQQYAQNIMNGSDRAAGVQNVQGSQSQQQQELGGGGIPGMSDAIAQRAQKNFAVQQGRLQQNAALEGQQMANSNMLTAANQAIALQNASTGVQSAINNLQLQANQATYQTVSSIMSGAGSLGGMFVANQRNNPYQPSYPGSVPSYVSSDLASSEAAFTNPTSEEYSGYLGSNVNSPYSEGLLNGPTFENNGAQNYQFNY